MANLSLRFRQQISSVPIAVIPLRSRCSSHQGDRHFHRAEDAVPTGLEDFGHLFPTQSFTPGGQKPGIGHGEMTLPRRPRQLFDLDATGGALHPPWSVEKENLFAPPQGDKCKTPYTQGVIAGCRSPHLEQMGLLPTWGRNVITKAGGPESLHLQLS